MRFSRQEYYSGLPFPPPGDLPDPGIEPGQGRWAEAEAGSGQGSAAPSHAHGHPGGVLRKDEGVARGGRLSSGLGWDPPPGGNGGQGGVDRGEERIRWRCVGEATGPRAMSGNKRQMLSCFRLKVDLLNEANGK